MNYLYIVFFLLIVASANGQEDTIIYPKKTIKYNLYSQDYLSVKHT